MSDYWTDKLIEERRMRRAFGDEMVDSLRFPQPIADKNLEGTPDENQILKPS
jgi:hypothetical protein